MSAPPESSELADAILLATASLIEAEGVEAVTMRAVAARAGYSPTAIYLCFENKEDLLKQMITHAYQSLVRGLSSGDAADEDLTARLRRVSVGYVRWALENPKLYQLVFECEAHRDIEVVRAKAVELWYESHDLLTAALEQGVIPYAVEPDALVRIWWATLHGIVWLALTNRLAPPEQPHSERDLEEHAIMLAETFVSAALGTLGTDGT